MQKSFTQVDAQELYRLLFTKDSKLSIMLNWHCNKPIKGYTTLRETWKEFISVLLYHPPNLAITHEGLYPFGLLHKGFFIPLEKCSKRVVHLLYILYKDRTNVFSDRKQYNASKFICSDFTFKEMKHIFHNSWRRQMLLMFCYYMEAQKEFWYRPLLNLSIQDLMLKGEDGHSDTFLLAISRALQGLCSIFEVQVTHNFLNDEQPVILCKK